MGQRLVLNAVGPAPEHLTIPHLHDIGRQRLRLRQHAALGDEFLTGAMSADEWSEFGVVKPEGVAVAVLEIDALAKILIDLGDVARMKRKPSLVLFERTSEDSQSEAFHAYAPRYYPLAWFDRACGSRSPDL